MPPKKKIKANNARKAFGVLALALLATAFAGIAGASSGGGCKVEESWQEWHVDSGVASKAELQRGARNFMNYCLGCHSLQYMRYNRIGEDLGLTEEQLKNNLMLVGGRVHDHVRSPMPDADAETWFGRAPPDLTLIARSKGPDYVYRFLKTFYLDDSHSTGVNNLALPNAAMPHVLASLQGTQKAIFVLEKCVENGQEKMVPHFDRFEQAAPGRMTPEEYDAFVRDTVSFLNYVSEPVRAQRERLGLWVVLFLAVFTLLAWMLKREIWKDVR